MKKKEKKTESEAEKKELFAPRLTGEFFNAFIVKWAHKLAPQKASHPPVPGPADSGFSIALFLLKILPYIALAGFLLSLKYETEGSVSFFWTEEPVPLKGLLRMVSVSALIGFLTNWLAIKMLFFPRIKRPILGQGLIPSQKDRIVYRLSHSISEELINSDLILEQLHSSGFIARYRDKLTVSLRSLIDDAEFQRDSMDVLQYYADAFLRSPSVQDKIKDFIDSVDFQNMQGFEAGVFRIYRMIKGKDMSDRIRELIQNVTFDVGKNEEKLLEYMKKIPDALENNSGKIDDTALSVIVFLIEQIDVKRIILENLQQFDEIRLEKLLLRTTSSQLQYIQYLGCLLGLFGGFFIWRPAESIVIFLSAGAAVWGADAMLMYLRKKVKKPG